MAGISQCSRQLIDWARISIFSQNWHAAMTKHPSIPSLISPSTLTLLQNSWGKPQINSILDIPAPEPMQLGQAKLTDVECRRHQKHKLCFYCGSPQDPVAVHPKPKLPQNTSKRVDHPSCSNTASAPQIITHQNFAIPVQIRHSKGFCTVSVLIDSRAAGKFINSSLVSRLNLPTLPLHNPMHIWSNLVMVKYHFLLHA